MLTLAPLASILAEHEITSITFGVGSNGKALVSIYYSSPGALCECIPVHKWADTLDEAFEAALKAAPAKVRATDFEDAPEPVEAETPAQSFTDLLV
jgi:hypothetical protein